MAGYRWLMASKSVLSIVGTQAYHSRRPVAVFAAHCGGFSVLAAVGAFGLTAESLGEPSRALDLRNLFALLMFATLLARSLWGFRQPGRCVPGAQHAFDTATARMIYLLLYCLIAFQMVFDLRSSGELHTDHCQFYVGCGVVALLSVRVFLKELLHPNTTG
jgi:hypothetical protein